jgi:hypothetical protein
MISMTALWLPVLLSAAFVFVASSIIHMVLGYHKNEYEKLPGEENILDAMRKEGVARGEYLFPKAESMKDAGTPEMIKKYERGPCGFITVVPSGKPGMGKSLVLWFLYSVVIGVFVAYIGRLTLPAGTEYIMVFRVTGAVATIAYTAALLQGSIWMGKPWGSTIKGVFDGVIYGLLTAGVFGWLWPG